MVMVAAVVAAAAAAAGAAAATMPAGSHAGHAHAAGDHELALAPARTDSGRALRQEPVPQPKSSGGAAAATDGEPLTAAGDEGAADTRTTTAGVTTTAAPASGRSSGKAKSSGRPGCPCISQPRQQQTLSAYITNGVLTDYQVCVREHP